MFRLFGCAQAYGRSVGIYNCKKGDFNASDLAVTSAFDYKAFVKLLDGMAWRRFFGSDFVAHEQFWTHHRSKLRKKPIFLFLMSLWRNYGIFARLTSFVGLWAEGTSRLARVEWQLGPAATSAREAVNDRVVHRGTPSRHARLSERPEGLHVSVLCLRPFFVFPLYQPSVCWDVLFWKSGSQNGRRNVAPRCRVKARVSFALNFIMALMEKLVDFLINVVIGVPQPIYRNGTAIWSLVEGGKTRARVIIVGVYDQQCQWYMGSAGFVKPWPVQ